MRKPKLRTSVLRGRPSIIGTKQQPLGVKPSNLRGEGCIVNWQCDGKDVCNNNIFGDGEKFVCVAGPIQPPQDS
ncbi:MAG: hypothetical protein HRT35_11610 [Algicola sp.]|nr:hypothetical protein [Algicola sp.]